MNAKEYAEHYSKQARLSPRARGAALETALRMRAAELGKTQAEADEVVRAAKSRG